MAKPGQNGVKRINVCSHVGARNITHGFDFFQPIFLLFAGERPVAFVEKFESMPPTELGGFRNGG